MPKAVAGVIGLLIFWAAIAFAGKPTKIMVFPLDAGASDQIPAWLGEGIALAVCGQLESQNLKVIGRRERIQLVENVDLPPDGRLSRASMIRVGQRAAADLLVMGTYSGSERNLKISLRVLDLRTLKLSGEMTANGPISAMAQMENELAWMIVSNVGLEKGGTRKDFQLRMRKVPNPAYALFIQSFGAPTESNRIELLKKAVNAYRNFPEAHLYLGQIFFSKRDCENALPHFTLARTEGSDHPENEFMRGTCYISKEQPEEAIQCLSPLLSHSRPFEVLNNIGVAYLRNGDNALALKVLLEAKSLAGSDATLQLNLAIAHHLQGNDAAARSVVEEAVRAHPKNGMLQLILSFLLGREGDGEKATAAANKARSLGVNVDKLQLETPGHWTRPVFSWSPPK